MSRESRRRKADKCCKAFAEQARRWTSKELGQWERIGDYTDGPAADFIVALDRWVHSGAEDDWNDVKRAFDRALDMYQVADAAFKREREGAA